ncbi:hypothetical protein M0813_19638 [Anaeramoeba flamelloides]|uniref:Uncharacterized protein n=1 Tax=Anaeramoeba flamelloides TaxID=1746091 RepID=A0ABQ8YN20_9EUKA|nr:hypothetical protein M0813_19638 [Anaeramoeba flamelloides]
MNNQNIDQFYHFNNNGCLYYTRLGGELNRGVKNALDLIYQEKDREEFGSLDEKKPKEKIERKNQEEEVILSAQDQQVINKNQEHYQNPNSRKGILSAIGKFNKFLDQRGVTRQVEKLSLKSIDCLLTSFIQVLKNDKGEDYVWNSFRTNICNVFAYYRSYWKDKQLNTPCPTLNNCWSASNALERKLGFLKEENKVGIHAEGLTDEEETKFFNKLDFNSDKDLLVAALWCVRKHTGYRGGELFDLKKSQFTWKGNKEVGRFIEISQTRTKTDQGGKGHKGAFYKFKRIYSFPSCEYDPYEIVTKYHGRCTPKRKQDSRFWCAVNWSKKRKYWYANINISRTRLTSYLQERIKRANIAKKITFHSTRATRVTKLVRKEVSDDQDKLHIGYQYQRGSNAYKKQDDLFNEESTKHLLIKKKPENKKKNQMQKEEKQHVLKNKPRKIIQKSSLFNQNSSMMPNLLTQHLQHLASNTNKPQPIFRISSFQNYSNFLQDSIIDKKKNYEEGKDDDD